MPSLSMTAKWLEALKPPTSGREVYHDEKLPGLCLTVSASGHKGWSVLYRVRGDRTKRRLTLPPYPAYGLAEAREAAQGALMSAKRGVDPAGPKVTPESEATETMLTFKALSQQFLDLYAKDAKRSWYEDEKKLKLHVWPRIGDQPAAEIRRRDVLALLDDIKTHGAAVRPNGTTGPAPVQANRVLALVRRVYNWGIERELVETNPCAMVKPVAAEKRRERVLLNYEIQAVWKALDAEAPVLATLFKVKLLTAQRSQEVESMRWRDVDLVSGWWNLEAEATKNGRSHRVPLSSMAVELLTTLHAITGGGEWVFPSWKKPTQAVANTNKAVYRIRDASGVDFNTHDLRRTAASHMASLDVPRLVIAKVLNHTDGSVTAIYDRYSYDREKREALEVWARKVQALVGTAVAAAR